MVDPATHQERITLYPVLNQILSVDSTYATNHHQSNSEISTTMQISGTSLHKKSREEVGQEEFIALKENRKNIEPVLEETKNSIITSNSLYESNYIQSAERREQKLTTEMSLTINFQEFQPSRSKHHTKENSENQNIKSVSLGADKLHQSKSF